MGPEAGTTLLGQRVPVEAVLLFCWLSSQGAAGEAEAGAPGADPTAAPAAPLRGNPFPQDQQPPQAGWVPEPCSRVGGLAGGHVPCHWGSPSYLWE